MTIDSGTATSAGCQGKSQPLGRRPVWQTATWVTAMIVLNAQAGQTTTPPQPALRSMPTVHSVPDPASCRLFPITHGLWKGYERMVGEYWESCFRTGELWRENGGIAGVVFCPAFPAVGALTTVSFGFFSAWTASIDLLSRLVPGSCSVRTHMTM